MVPNRSESDLADDDGSYSCRRKVCSVVHVKVLDQTEEYVIIDKPWDVRMYGDFQITIEKLLFSYLGSTSLNLKWVHRLDFATSGVLCVGLNRKFASRACDAFQNRHTEKVYLAVLQGHVDISSIQILSERPCQLDLNKKRKHEATGNQEVTVAPHSSTWQDRALELSLSTYMDALKRAVDDISAFSPDLQHRIKAMSECNADDFRRNSKLRKQLRQTLKHSGVYIESVLPSKRSAFEELPPRPVHEKVASSADVRPLPENYCRDSHVFRLVTDSDGKADPSTVYITAPIEGVHGDFRMRISPSEGDGNDIDDICDNHADEDCLGPRKNRHRSRVCETRMQVLCYGTYQGHPVTKVRLTPITGRRHQLRLHCVALGHPIVGDGTYNDTEMCNHAERMMLHAQSLRIKMPVGRRKGSGVALSDDGEIICASTEDPFPFSDSFEMTCLL